VDTPSGSPKFLNAVLVVDTTLSPRSLMERAQSTEAAYGRTRDVPNGPRTLDIDVLAVGDVTSDDEDLRVPHPRLAERAFVLVPWADVDPEFSVPGLGRVVELSSAVDATGVRRLDEALEIPA
jgi:2-amino-4-hydroxy-6-hydroxymethyldihydropteridine diphosphokinase